MKQIKKLKRVTAIATATVLAAAVQNSSNAAEKHYEDSCGSYLREIARTRLCESLRNGVCAGNLSYEEAVSRLKAYDRVQQG